MPTESRPPVSRRKLGLFGLAALIGAGLIVATGIRAREDSSAKLREWTDSQAVPTVADLQARRLDLVRDSIRETLIGGELDRFRPVVESLADEFDPVEIAMAAVTPANTAERA